MAISKQFVLKQMCFGTFLFSLKKKLIYFEKKNLFLDNM